MKPGYLYIIVNEAFPSWIKVGTTWNLNDRLHTYQTGDPLRRYKIIYSLYHINFRTAEKKIKSLMKPFAKKIINEWYEIDIHMAIPRLEEALTDYDKESVIINNP